MCHQRSNELYKCIEKYTNLVIESNTSPFPLLKLNRGRRRVLKCLHQTPSGQSWDLRGLLSHSLKTWACPNFSNPNLIGKSCFVVCMDNIAIETLGEISLRFGESIDCWGSFLKFQLSTSSGEMCWAILYQCLQVPWFEVEASSLQFGMLQGC